MTFYAIILTFYLIIMALKSYFDFLSHNYDFHVTLVTFIIYLCPNFVLLPYFVYHSFFVIILTFCLIIVIFTFNFDLIIMTFYVTMSIFLN